MRASDNPLIDFCYGLMRTLHDCNKIYKICSVIVFQSRIVVASLWKKYIVFPDTKTLDDVRIETYYRMVSSGRGTEAKNDQEVQVVYTQNILC